MRLRECLDITDGSWPRELVGPDGALYEWMQRVGIDEVGFIKAVRLLNEGQIAVEFYTDEAYVPTRDAEAMHIDTWTPQRLPHPSDVTCGSCWNNHREYEARTVWATVDILETPPACWPMDKAA